MKAERTIKRERVTLGEGTNIEERAKVSERAILHERAMKAERTIIRKRPQWLTKYLKRAIATPRSCREMALHESTVKIKKLYEQKRASKVS